LERLQKLMAHAGIASRRESEKMIEDGRVKVNGKVIREMGFKTDPDKDVIEVDNQIVSVGEEKVYLLLYKPKGYLSTTDDPRGRRTVMDLVDVPQRIYPVGRLDYDTEGLLILTNDGELTYKFTHPSHEVNKVYHALVKGDPTQQTLATLRRGVLLEDGPTAHAQVKQLKKIQGNTLLEIIIHEGRNRQVRRMCKAVGHPVLDLKRVAIGDLTLSNLVPGQYLHISKDRLERAAH